MDKQTFFATSAQVMPALLIALMVEVGFIGREIASRLPGKIKAYEDLVVELKDPARWQEDRPTMLLAELRATSQEARRAADASGTLARLVGAAASVAIAILVSEMCALIVLIRDTSEAFQKGTAASCIAAMLMAIVTVAGLPLYRVFKAALR